MKSIRLVLSNDVSPVIANGMDLYRLVLPYSGVIEEHGQMLCMSQEEFNTTPCDADVYVMNRPYSFQAKKVKDAGKFLIVDVDDYWVLPTWHKIHPKNLAKELERAKSGGFDPQSVKAVQRAYDREVAQEKNTLDSCRLADVVTCTTEVLRAKFAKIGIDAVVIKNTIPKDVIMFTTEKQRHNRMRFGWIGGAFHIRDVSLMYGGIRNLRNDKSEVGKWQILSTFNHTSEYAEIEKIITDGYKTCSKEYTEYLLKYTRTGSHMGNDEHYKRLWAMPPSEYGVMYEQVDVALIPLQHGEFNSCKSELKLIEAGSTGCAAIVSDVLPYAPYLNHGVNCLVAKGSNGWYTAMKYLLNNPHMVKVLADNLAQTIRENFDHQHEANKLKLLIQ